MVRVSSSLLVLLAAALAGCASPLWKTAPKAAALPSLGQCTVEMRDSDGSAKLKQVDVDANSTVAQVLAKSGGNKKFNRFQAELCRQLPNGKWHKMQVPVDPVKDKIDFAHDYHVQPGDMLVVKEDTSDMIDDMTRGFIPAGAFGS
jgi:hypothetical protein